MSDFLIRPRDIPRSGDDTPAASLLRYVWRMSGWHQLTICLLAVITAGLTAIPLELQRRIVDDVIANAELGLLWVLAGLYLLVLLVQGLTKYVLRLYQGWLSESAIRYNRAHLSRIFECRQAGAASRENGEAGQAVSVIGQEVDKLGGFVGEGLSQPCTNLAMLLAVGGYMIAVEPLVALISLVFILPQIVLVPLLQRRINRLIAARVRMMRALGDSLTALPEGEGGPDEGGLEDSDLPRQLDDIYDNRLRTFLLKFGLKAANNLLSALAPLSVLLIGGIMVIQGQTTIGVVVAFISGFDRLSAPLRELIAYYRVAAQANVQHRMIARWM
jgi:ABC-type bacteriocin/lantibiotic exporter with double-glycine peptidase domain